MDRVHLSLRTCNCHIPHYDYSSLICMSSYYISRMDVPFLYLWLALWFFLSLWTLEIAFTSPFCFFIFPSEHATAISLTDVHRSLGCPITTSLARAMDFIFPFERQITRTSLFFFFFSSFSPNLQLPYPSIRMFIARLAVPWLFLSLGYPHSIDLWLWTPNCSISSCCAACQRRRRQGERTEGDGEKTVLDGEDDTVAELMPARRVMSEVGAALAAPHPANRDRLPASSVTAPLDLCRRFRSFCTLPHR